VRWGRFVRLELERLESRDVPNAGAVLVGSVLTISGGPNRDRIDVVQDPFAQTITVEDSGVPVATFAESAVTAINILPSPGDDVLRIAPDITLPATITAGSGNDLLFAGGGPTTLIGGSGNDKLIAGAADVTIITGSGNNYVDAGFGTATINATLGRGVIQRVTPADTVTANANYVVNTVPGDPPPIPETPLAPAEVDALLQRAAAATASDDAIVAVVDRQGRILGIRVEGNVDPAITGSTLNLVFAVDGAVSLARTGAYFANDQAPLTSRTIQFISQSTITQREVDSNPSITSPASTLAGPGFVAPIGPMGHFPPGVMNTPQVDLFEIEHTNRDSAAGLPARFNINPAFVPPGQTIFAPESYGLSSGLEPAAQSRGIGTLPGGIPLYKKDANGQPRLVGGIGVFFPGKTGYASEENSSFSTNFDPTKPDRTLEAEYIATLAASGLPITGAPTTDIGVLGVTPGFFIPGLPTGPLAANGVPLNLPRIDLAGITLPTVGPGGIDGLQKVLAEGPGFGIGSAASGAGRGLPLDHAFLAGVTVPFGFLVTPHAGGGLSAAQVNQIIQQGIDEANLVRSQIRLPSNQHAEMAFSVTDSAGEVLGLFRMPDATYFSIGVAVAKARNVAYYADPTQLQPADQVPGVPLGTAFTNRTIRYLSLPRFPEGIDGDPPGPFSQLNSPGIDPNTALETGPPLPASAYFGTVVGYDAFNPQTNFHQVANPLNQNGVVFFPGSSPLYGAGAALIGGLGVSGDGVNEDDVITYFSSQGYGTPSSVPRADQQFVRGVRLPYFNFDRNPENL